MICAHDVLQLCLFDWLPHHHYGTQSRVSSDVAQTSTSELDGAASRRGTRYLGTQVPRHLAFPLAVSDAAANHVLAASAITPTLIRAHYSATFHIGKAATCSSHASRPAVYLMNLDFATSPTFLAPQPPPRPHLPAPITHHPNRQSHAVNQLLPSFSRSVNQSVSVIPSQAINAIHHLRHHHCSFQLALALNRYSSIRHGAKKSGSLLPHSLRSW